MIVVEYDPAWPRHFARQWAAIQAVDNGWIAVIEHFGSTSVPGLAAEPIIDIAAAVPSVDRDGAALAAAVRALGYVPFDAGMPGRLMLTRDEDGVRAQQRRTGMVWAARFRRGIVPIGATGGTERAAPRPLVVDRVLIV